MSSEEENLVAKTTTNNNNSQQKDQKFQYKMETINIFGTQVDKPLIALMMNNFLLNASCSLINPFFPKVGKEAGLSNFQDGLVIGMHPLCGFLFGMLMSKHLMKIGRKKIMLGSILTTIITLFIMGVSYNFREVKFLFFIVNVIARGFMGMARSGYGSATFAYAPMLWPEKVEKMIGLMESATGLGLLFGPLIGAGFYAMFEAMADEGVAYQMSFYILCIIFSSFVYSSYKMLPVDQKVPPKQSTLSIFTVLGRRQIWTLFFMLTFVSTSLSFTYELWTELLETYGIGVEISAVTMTTGTLTYILALQFIPGMMQQQIKVKGNITFRKVLETCGGSVSVLAVIFMAPESNLGLPQAFWPLMVGMLFVGFGQACSILPYIPEQNMNVVKFYPQKEKEELTRKITRQVRGQLEDEKLQTGKDFTQAEVEVNAGEIMRKLFSDMSAGLFMSGYSLGTFVGPTIGGLIVDQFEQSYAARHSCSVHAPDDLIVNNEAFKEYMHNCQFQYGFKQIARCIYITLAVLTVLYLTLGQGYLGWRDLFTKKSDKKDMILDKPVKQDLNDDGRLTDALITDSELQFTDAENNLEYDEETEAKLEQIRKKSDNEITSSNGSARSNSLV